MRGWTFLAVFILNLSAPLWAKTSEVISPTFSEVMDPEALETIAYSDQSFSTATRSLQHIKHVTDNVTVVTREELDRWPVQDLDEALALVSGIVVQDSGNIGQTATAQIYGSKEREVRVMIDGVTFNATTTGGMADLSQIPLDIVEKIEIIKGASSSVWGSAMGGVINIITRRPGKTWLPHGSGTLGFGEYSTQREHGEIWGAAGPLRYYGFGSYAESGGFRPNGDELEKRAYLKGDLPLTDAVSLKGSFGYSGSKISEFDIPDLSIGGKRKVYSHYGNAGMTLSPAENFYLDIFYNLSERSFRRDTLLLPSRAVARFSKAQSVIHEAMIHGTYEVTDNQTLVFGSDIGAEVYRDAVFQGGATRNNVNKDDSRHAYYGNYQLRWKFLDAVLGSRLDVVKAYGINFDPSAGLGVHLPFWETVMRANVARAFNAPSLVDRYLSVGTLVANPDLDAEYAVVYNLGLETVPHKMLKEKAVFFQTFLEDSIQTITRSDGLRQPVNRGRERRTGFETETKLGPWKGLSALYGTVLVMALDSSGAPVQSRPRFTQDVKINYSAAFWGMDFNAHLAGRHTDLVYYSGTTYPSDQSMLCDGKILWTLPKIYYGRLTFFLEVENLFNNDFSFDGGRYPHPKRNFESGAAFKF